jgi:pyrroline-5-carboxylate reductase
MSQMNPMSPLNPREAGQGGPLPLGRVAVIGAGKMGTTLIRALTAGGALDASRLVATARHRDTLDRVRDELGVAVTLDNRGAAEGADLVLLCVKPQQAEAVLAELSQVVGEEQLLVTILAGVSIAHVESRLAAAVPVVRAMPNTASLIGAGMTALCGGARAEARHLEIAERVFQRVGRTLVLDERHFDAVTGLSASGPAFLYVVIEALAEGGVKVGLPRQVAIELAAQACLGAGRMVLETGSHPALLKDAVTTPGGCTVDGILKLEEGGLRVTLIKAVAEASRRARDLVEPEEG